MLLSLRKNGLTSLFKEVRVFKVFHLLSFFFLGARLRGRTATQRSKKGSEKVLGRVLGMGFSEGF